MTILHHEMDRFILKNKFIVITTKYITKYSGPDFKKKVN